MVFACAKYLMVACSYILSNKIVFKHNYMVKYFHISILKSDFNIRHLLHDESTFGRTITSEDFG